MRNITSSLTIRMNKSVGYGQFIIPYPCHFPRYSQDPKIKSQSIREVWDPVSRRLIRTDSCYIPRPPPCIPEFSSHIGNGTIFTTTGNFASYVDGVWLAVGDDTDKKRTTLVSTDGITWTAPSTVSVFTGAGKYITRIPGTVTVAIGYTSGNAGQIVYTLTPSDIVNYPWIPVEIQVGSSMFSGPANSIASSVAGGPSDTNCVVVGRDTSNSGNTILISGDGRTNYRSVTLASGSKFVKSGNSVAFVSASKWVAVGDDNGGTNTIIYSNANISDCYVATGGFNGAGNSVVYKGTGTSCVAVGYNLSSGNKVGSILYTTNLSSWAAATGTIFSKEGLAIAYGNDVWVAVGDDDGGSHTITYSTNANGTSGWTIPSGLLFSKRGTAVAYDGVGRWIAVGSNLDGSGVILQSTDNAQTWSAVTGVALTDEPTSVSYGNGIWVVTSNGSSSLLYLNISC